MPSASEFIGTWKPQKSAGERIADLEAEVAALKALVEVLERAIEQMANGASANLYPG